MRCRTAVVSTFATAILAGACGHEARWIDDRVIGSGRIVTETRAVGAFDRVTVDGPLHVRLQAGRAPTLQVTADDNLLPLVRSEQRGDGLHLFLDGVSITSTHELLVEVSSPEVREIEGNAAARIEGEGLSVEVLATRLTAASSARLSGRADRHELQLSGASRCAAEELRSRDVSAGLSGASYGRLTVSHSLRVEASGASTLEYLGDPQLVSTVSGESVVRRVGP